MPQLPAQIYWLPLVHSCGCCIDWGVEPNERERLLDFLASAAPYPCPWHGSAGGIPSPASPDAAVYLAGNDVWYRKAPPEQAENGRRNRQAALAAGPQLPVTKAEEIHEVKLAMARHAPVLELPAISTPGETGRVLNVQRVATRLPIEQLAWLETTDGELYRLPPQLFAWAFDVVAMVLARGGNQQARLFPTRIDFGRIDGHAYADIL
ncbi:MAG: hypothetical protein QOH92_575 [Chloroflexota bacterium]|nr:hypothetical protein [Chloroflexota bacterium]